MTNRLGRNNDTINLGSGNDIAYGGRDNDTITGGIGNDTIYGEHGNDTIYGDNKNVIPKRSRYQLNGQDIIYGGDGDDTIYGRMGNDHIYGGAGLDIMYGDDDNDYLYIEGEASDSTRYEELAFGGSGDDTYVVDKPFTCKVRIQDTESENNVLDLSIYDSNKVAFVKVNGSDDLRLYALTNGKLGEINITNGLNISAISKFKFRDKSINYNDVNVFELWDDNNYKHNIDERRETRIDHSFTLESVAEKLSRGVIHEGSGTYFEYSNKYTNSFNAKNVNKNKHVLYLEEYDLDSLKFKVHNNNLQILKSNNQALVTIENYFNSVDAINKIKLSDKIYDISDILSDKIVSPLDTMITVERSIDGINFTTEKLIQAVIRKNDVEFFTDTPAYITSDGKTMIPLFEFANLMSTSKIADNSIFNGIENYVAVKEKITGRYYQFYLGTKARYSRVSEIDEDGARVYSNFTYTMDVLPEIQKINGKKIMMVHIGAVRDVLDIKVNWNEEERIVECITNGDSIYVSDKKENPLGNNPQDGTDTTSKDTVKIAFGNNLLNMDEKAYKDTYYKRRSQEEVVMVDTYKLVEQFNRISVDKIKAREENGRYILEYREKVITYYINSNRYIIAGTIRNRIPTYDYKYMYSKLENGSFYTPLIMFSRFLDIEYEFKEGDSGGEVVEFDGEYFRLTNTRFARTDYRNILYAHRNSMGFAGQRDERNFIKGNERGTAIVGGFLGDYILGMGGNDQIQGLKGDDLLYGCVGNDILRGDEGSDSLHGGVGDDELNGGSEDDNLFGQQGRDTLIGDSGNDTLHGGEDNDTYIFRPGFGNDVVYEEARHSNGNRIGFVDMSSNDFEFSRIVNTDNLLIQKKDSDDSVIASNFFLSRYDVIGFSDELLNRDNFIHFNRMSGTNYDDVIDVVDGFNSVFAGKGNDIINGTNNNDFLHGEENDDYLYGRDGIDRIYGGDGNDSLHGDGGNDNIYGNDGKDSLHGGTGNDSLDGGDGDDSLYGDSGDDSLVSKKGINILNGGTGNDIYNVHDIALKTTIIDNGNDVNDRLNFFKSLSNYHLSVQMDSVSSTNDLVIRDIHTQSETVIKNYLNSIESYDFVASNLDMSDLERLIQEMATFETERGMSLEQLISTDMNQYSSFMQTFANSLS